MRYPNITKAEFIDRPNRFIAHVMVNGHAETVHVKNTGRCKELLIKDAEVYLTEPDSPSRKTKYDLVTVRKANGVLFNIDSQAPNKVLKEWLSQEGFTKIVPEYTYGDSRLDFYLEKKSEKYLMEVKGCTLEIDGIGYFPDAPTDRGVKHIHELIKAKEAGYTAVLAFVIQMDGVYEVKGHKTMHPEFAEAMEEARKKGVLIWNLPCHVEPDSLEIKAHLETNRLVRI
ncbi:MAG: DNA/RNA nuclease SfsA [Dehalococcoidales bacterium]|nr:DNA/RNA nuclease SfsA [Dehalococcoidales bacterium]